MSKRDDTTDDKILELFTGGALITEVSREFNISPSTLSKWRRLDSEFDDTCWSAEGQGIMVQRAFLILGATGLLVFTSRPFPEFTLYWPYIFTGWEKVDAWIYGIVAGCSVLNLVANINLAKAYHSAEASWLAPFDYSYLVFATFWGLVIWDDGPDGVIFIGLFLIAGAGTFVYWRERLEKKVPFTLWPKP